MSQITSQPLEIGVILGLSDQVPVSTVVDQLTRDTETATCTCIMVKNQHLVITNTHVHAILILLPTPYSLVNCCIIALAGNDS